jgi:hypothetical protein
VNQASADITIINRLLVSLSCAITDMHHLLRTSVRPETVQRAQELLPTLEAQYDALVAERQALEKGASR